MKKYNYKIQWLFNRTSVEEISFKHLISLLGVRSLDAIILRDINLKIIDTYTGFISFPFALADVETLKYIRKQLKLNNKIVYVEVLRR